MLLPKSDMKSDMVLLVAVLLAILVGCSDNASLAPEPESKPVIMSGVTDGVGLSFDGEHTLEERIANADVIVRARLTSVSPVVDTVVPYIPHNLDDPIPTSFTVFWEFSLNVLEYLKGSGGNEIKAVVSTYTVPSDTREEAEADIPSVAAARNSKWDDREAIIFLQNSDEFTPSPWEILPMSIEMIPRTQQADVYYLGTVLGDSPQGYEDGYSITSPRNKLWLPAAVGASTSSRDANATGASNSQSFLLEEPSRAQTRSGTAPQETPTITLSDLKAQVAALVNRMEGSEAVKECVQRSYRFERRNEYFREVRGKGTYPEYPDHEMQSGLAAGSIVYRDEHGRGLSPSRYEDLWLDGGNADLFEVELGPATAYDGTGDGVDNMLSYDRSILVTRPLPAREYRFHFNNRRWFFLVCEGYVQRYEWTVHVTAPEGTVHETFFDPVAIGEAVGADGSVGVLEPASFESGGGASAVIAGIAWEAGKVAMSFSPSLPPADHHVDFIALDGSVALRLDLDDASLASDGDSHTHTLTWTVCYRPWSEGDQLMLRISQSPPDLTGATNDPTC